MFAAIDNLWKGTASQAVQNLNLMFGPPERRDALSFFRSRWVEVPGHVARASGPLPRASAPPAPPRGSSRRGALDVGLLVCDGPEPVSAARFTRSGTLAAPVIVTRERTQLDGLRAVAVNSGNANAATGRPGLDEAAKMQGGAAMAPRRPRTAWRSAPRA